MFANPSPGSQTISPVQWNEAVRAVDRMTPLPGVERASGARFHHPFEVSVRPGKDPERRKWRIDIVPGTVSDNLVMYSYMKENDPRGWKMPPGYVTPSLLKAYGPNFPLVDRSPFETVDPPYLLVNAPGVDPTVDPGDFILHHGRPTFFQQSVFEGCTLYRASVTVSLTPFRASKDLTPFSPALTTQAQRFRYFAGRLPAKSDGVRAGSAVELARLYLARKPDGTGPATDRLYVQQYRFWCLQALAVEPSLGIGDSIDLSYLGQGLAALGFGGAVAGMIGAELFEMYANLQLDAINQTLESAGMTEFWTA